MENLSKSSDTYNKLLSSGKSFFLKYGYKSSPLRKIVSDAGFTSGAFYGYFNSKEELFYAITDSTASKFCALLDDIIKKIQQLPTETRLIKMNSIYIEKIPEIVDFLLENKDEVRLILTCSEGTKYENFFDKIEQNNIDLIVNSTSNLSDDNLSYYTLNVLMHGYFTMLAKVVLTETDKDKIISCMTQISEIYEKGIISLLTK